MRGSNVRLELRLFVVSRGAEAVLKREYEVPASGVRGAVHQFANEVLELGSPVGPEVLGRGSSSAPRRPRGKGHLCHRRRRAGDDAPLHGLERRARAGHRARRHLLRRGTRRWHLRALPRGGFSTNFSSTLGRSSAQRLVAARWPPSSRKVARAMCSLAPATGRISRRSRAEASTRTRLFVPVAAWPTSRTKVAARRFYVDGKRVSFRGTTWRPSGATTPTTRACSSLGLTANVGCLQRRRIGQLVEHASADAGSRLEHVPGVLPRRPHRRLLFHARRRRALHREPPWTERP